jgi:hypothetical protein
VERATIAGETEVLGENLAQRHFVPPQIPHDQVRFRTPDCSGGKPATNRLSYGAANHMTYIGPKYHIPSFLNFTGVSFKSYFKCGPTVSNLFRGIFPNTI